MMLVFCFCDTNASIIGCCTVQVAVALQVLPYQDSYPMDYYANDSLGPWTANNKLHRPVQCQRKHITVETEKEAERTERC